MKQQIRNYRNINLPLRMERYITSCVIDHVNEWGLSNPFQIRNSDLAKHMTFNNVKSDHFTTRTIINNLKKMPRRFVKVSMLFHGDNRGTAYELDIESICSSYGAFTAFKEDFKEKCCPALWKKIENLKNKNSLKWDI